MLFTLHKFITGDRVVSKLLYIIVFFAVIYLLNLPTVPKAAKATPFPFPENSCLIYQATRLQNDVDNLSYPQKICFSNNHDGSFVEKQANLQTSFDKKGFADLTDADVANWKNNLKASNDPFFAAVASSLNFHNRYFGQPKLKPGIIFYNKYPVGEATEFNNQKTYLVEVNPWTDTNLTYRGVISKFWSGLQRKYNRLRYQPTERKFSSRDKIERYYYNYETGILEGKEILIVERSPDGKIISSTMEERSVLQEIIENK